ncbi:MAG: M28 family peptidase [Proteobacteria bacterium]|nr:M28 family peptidase [Pseudomonadota bacterium]
MKRYWVLLALLLGSSSGQASPVSYVRKGVPLDFSLSQALLETKDYIIYRDPGSQDADFQNLYWINLEDSLYDRLSLEQLGRVEAYVADNFAVLTIEPRHVTEAAELLHEQRWSCGQLIRLQGDEVPLQVQGIKPVPMISINESVEQIKDLHAQVKVEHIRQTVEDMVALGTRYAKSQQAADVTRYLLKRYIDLAGTRSDVSIKAFPHKSSPAQSSIVVRIQGQSRPDELIILGSHIDSIARGSDIAPGADDNASGTASQLEVFQAIIEQNLHFERTIEIHGYAAEELGLLGSLDIASQYVAQGKKVIAMVQNDMNMFKATEYDMIWLVTNDIEPQLTEDLEQLISKYQTVAVDKAPLRAGTSDHRSWNRQGIAVAFPTENPTNYNKKIHTPMDTIQQSGAFTQSLEFVKLSLSFLAHYAGLQTAQKL